jgi:hypothetical protein
MHLARPPASEYIIMAITGHVPPKMFAHYSHVRLETKRKALHRLAGGTQGWAAKQSVTQKFGIVPEATENNWRGRRDSNSRPPA